jgi:N-acylneuraminate cytidylyltransferase
LKPLVIIPARGGSKSIPKKNIKLLAGKPLLHYTIEVALELFNAEDICVSTDSEEIKGVAEQLNITVPFLRPKSLATDTAGTRDVLLHAVDFYKEKAYDTIVLLQPTSPFKTSKHVKEALQLFTSEIDMVVSVYESDLNPYYNLFEEKADGFLQQSKPSQITRRQDCPKVYAYNGAVYIINIASLQKKAINQFNKIIKYTMDKKSSLDIDTMEDWQLAEFYINQQQQ